MYTSHGRRVASATQLFGKTTNQYAFTREGGWEAKSSTECYILKARAHISAGKVTPEEATELSSAAHNFSSRL